jgi:prepilin-type N-terminal cleavage/methylation domain-containing protein
MITKAIEAKTLGGIRNDGFTLVEMMVAMGILVFGLTALAGVLGVGVDTRRTAEQVTVGASQVDRIVHELEMLVLPDRIRAWRAQVDGIETEPLAPESLEPVTPTPIPGYPGMNYAVEFDLDQERPDLVLARIRVRWRSQGEEQGETFCRLLPLSVPLGVRRAARDEARR